MPLSQLGLETLINAELIVIGARGSNRGNVADAIATGCVNHITTAAAWTAPVTGTTGGAGIATGIGITGIVSATLATSIYTNWLSLSGFSGGVNGLSMATALSEAIVAHLAAAATLTGTTTVVCSGSGAVVPGGFTGMNGNIMGALIRTRLVALGANPEKAVNLGHFCNGIGRAVVDAIHTTGTSLITVTPVGGCGGGPGADVAVGTVS